MFHELHEMILTVENEIIEQGYDVDKVLTLNKLHNDMDLVMFALRFLVGNVYEAMIEGISENDL